MASGRWLVERGQRPGVRGSDADIHHSSFITHHSSSNPQSLIPNLSSALRLRPPPSFSVRTPTATVTDLGTEFGVEVNEQGDTTSHVFVGQVKVASVGGTAIGTQEHVLHAGQTATSDAAKTVVTMAKGSGKRFLEHCPNHRERVPRGGGRVDRYGRLQRDVDGQFADPFRRLLGAGRPRVVAGGAPVRQPTPVPGCFAAISSVTTWPGGGSLVPWPGFQASGSRSGFTETGGSGGVCVSGR